MEIESLLKKLRYRPGLRATILNAPHEYEEAFTGLGFSRSLGTPKSQFTILFVRNRVELDRHAAETIGGIEEDGLFWLVYPKGGSSIKSDLNRDIIWELMKPTGLRPVALVAVDDDWSAMRLRPEGKVKG
jgi:hypothetical protein